MWLGGWDPPVISLGLKKLSSLTRACVARASLPAADCELAPTRRQPRATLLAPPRHRPPPAATALLAPTRRPPPAALLDLPADHRPPRYSPLPIV
jgi:hypothetical protein